MSHGPVQRVIAHARWESRLLLRNGEQLLLTLLIPAGLFLGLALLDLWPASGNRVAAAVATVWTVSALAGCFTSLAIGTGFERRSGALRFLATTPLTRLELLAGKVAAAAFVTGLSVALVGVLALVVGWRPDARALLALCVLALGCAALGAWAFALAGMLRAEAVLAVANGIFVLLLIVGGIVIPLDRLPSAMATVAGYLPTGALNESLQALLVDGSGPTAQNIVVLVVWLVVGAALARRYFRWS